MYPAAGQKFAIAEEKTVLSWFFRRYRVETVEPFPGNRPVPEARTLHVLTGAKTDFQLILKPSCGFRVRLFRRERK